MNKFETRAEFAEKMVDKYFNELPNNVVSDIGAGFGHMQSFIESKGFVWQPFDYVKKMDWTIIWNLNHAAPKEVKNAGGVIFLEVIEHLANPLLGIQNIANHMEKGGVLILTTPNPKSSKSVLSLFLKGGLFSFQKKHLEEHHVFTPWQHVVEYFLESSGFEIKEYAIVDISYQKDKPKNLKGKVKKLIYNYIERRNIETQGLSYGLVAIKK